MKWFLKITTEKGTQLFPYDGYRTKRDALSQLELAKRIKEIKEVTIVKDLRR